MNDLISVQKWEELVQQKQSFRGNTHSCSYIYGLYMFQAGRKDDNIQHFEFTSFELAFTTTKKHRCVSTAQTVFLHMSAQIASLKVPRCKMSPLAQGCWSPQTIMAGL